LETAMNDATHVCALEELRGYLAEMDERLKGVTVIGSAGENALSAMVDAQAFLAETIADLAAWRVSPHEALECGRGLAIEHRKAAEAARRARGH
jgi:hypothetical protein